MMFPLQPPPPAITMVRPSLHPTYTLHPPCSYPYLVSMRNLLDPENPHFCGKLAPHWCGYGSPTANGSFDAVAVRGYCEVPWPIVCTWAPGACRRSAGARARGPDCSTLVSRG